MADNDFEVRVDKAVVMLAATVMITSGPPSLCLGSALFHKMCRLIQTCLSHESTDVQLKALQSTNSMLQKPELRTHFVKELGAGIFGKLRPYVLPEGEKRPETELPPLEDLSDGELAVIQEAVKGILLVLTFAKGDKEKMFVNLLVRTLSRFLSPAPTTHFKQPSCTANVKKVHDFALTQLNVIGKEHPEAFKVVMNGCPAIRQRVEIAATYLALTQKQREVQRQKSITGAAKQQTAAQPIQPTIKLATDFSAFK